MKPTDTGDTHDENLLPRICDLLLANGIKATTMDSIASQLHVSKRTLYERFQSKEQMVLEVLNHMNAMHKAAHESAHKEAANVMEGLMKGINLQRRLMARTSPAFFRDLDTIFREVMENASDKKETFYSDFAAYLQKGIEEGYILPDINPHLQSRIVGLQMEALKRMEDHFPPGISLVEAYDSISLGFVRSMATSKGHEVIESMRNRRVKP